MSARGERVREALGAWAGRAGYRSLKLFGLVVVVGLIGRALGGGG